VTRVDLDAAEARAMAATSEAWEVYQHRQGFLVLQLGDRHISVSDLFSMQDALHIAGMDPPTTLALAAELRAARTFRDDIAAALAPGRWRGFDGPDGVSKDEVLADVAAALARYDQAVGP
jgi:hypothetical protein